MIGVAIVNETGLRRIHFQRLLFLSEDFILDPLEIPPVANGAMIV
jgi:hypothetical protein